MLKGIVLQAAVAAVKEMAKENYNKGYGYQVIVEAMDDADIAAEIESLPSQKAALAHMVEFAENMTASATTAATEVFA